jgi:hypothetical protein
MSIAFTSCSKKDNSPAPYKPDSTLNIPLAKWPTSADIYFVGSITKGGSNAIPTIWKNGKPTTLFNTLGATPNEYAKALAVTVGNGNVYVVGSASVGNFNVAVSWENGILKRIPTKSTYSEANAITVSGNDIYIAGMADNKPTLWKNGVETTLSKLSGFATAIFVQGTDVYVSGNTFDRNSHSTLWKNGNLVPLDSDGSAFESFVNAMWVNGTDTYLAGEIKGTGAVMWKNGKSNVLFDGGNTTVTSATDIIVKGADVYATGYIGSKTVLWKNGTATNMPSNDRNNIRNKISIGFNGNDLYLSSGLDANAKGVAAILWQNNIAYQFSNDLSVITGMAVVPH